MNIESKHINTVNRKKNYQSTLICLCFHQCLDKKVGTSCPEFPTILKEWGYLKREDTYPLQTMSMQFPTEILH